MEGTLAGLFSTMSKEVLLLGLLKKKPMYGYEIKQLVEDELTHIAPISAGSLYHNLKTLEKKGLLTKKLLKDTAHPEKQIYHITPEGESTFDQLIKQNITNFERPHLALDVSLYFLEKKDIGQFLVRLKELLGKLREYHAEAERFRDELSKKGLPLHIVSIPEHYLAHSKAEIGFLEGFIKGMEKEAKA
jgi:DNA-binding PadR family transcriptional regulator